MGKSVPSQWGNLPLHHKRTIYLRDVVSVMIDTTPVKKGREFTIVVSANKNREENDNNDDNNNNNNNDKIRENETVNILQLRAESFQVRLGWTDALNDILHYRNNQ